MPAYLDEEIGHNQRPFFWVGELYLGNVATVNTSFFWVGDFIWVRVTWPQSTPHFPG